MEEIKGKHILFDGTTRLGEIPYSWKFSRDLYFKNFVVQTKFVKYKTLKYFRSSTQILDMAKIRENYFLEIDNESKFVKYRALENNQLYGTSDYCAFRF